MRSVLQALAKRRSQHVQLCYGQNCADSTADSLVSQAPDTLANSLMQDKCMNDKLVYGHNVFENIQAMNLPDAGSAYVVMVRKPMEWAASLYKQFHGSYHWEGSFDDWVQSGRAAATWANNILGSPDPSMVVETWNEWLRQKQPLILITEQFEESVLKFAKVMGATPDEQQDMLAAISHENKRLDSQFNLTLSEDSLTKLMKILEPLEQIYQQSVTAFSYEKSARNRVSNIEDETQHAKVHITMPISWRDDEE